MIMIGNGGNKRASERKIGDEKERARGTNERRRDTKIEKVRIVDIKHHRKGQKSAEGIKKIDPNTISTVMLCSFNHLFEAMRESRILSTFVIHTTKRL